MKTTPQPGTSALRRIRAIAPMLESLRLVDLGQRPARVCAEEQCTLAAIATEIAAAEGVSTSTIWNWYRRYRVGGYNALANRTRNDKGTSRFFAAHPEAAQIAESEGLILSTSFKAAYEALRRSWSGPMPAYSTVRAYLRKCARARRARRARSKVQS